jgi:AraC-like DNA-binding protein
MTAWYTPVAPSLAAHGLLACSWTAVPSGEHRLVPDGCADLLWLSSNAVILCGPEERAWTFALPPGLVAVGVRFRPGALSAYLGVDVSTLRNRRVPWSSFVGRDRADEFALALQSAAAVDLDVARRLFESTIADGRDDERANDPLAEKILDELTARPQCSQSELAASVDLSARQLHRRSLRLFGYGTSTLARILRIQRVLAVATTTSGASLAELAVAAGYADQSHLTRDFRAITGLTPSAFLAEYFPTFPDMSDPFKTATPLAVKLTA